MNTNTGKRLAYTDDTTASHNRYWRATSTTTGEQPTSLIIYYGRSWLPVHVYSHELGEKGQANGTTHG
jgi:hypothetical protein